VGNALIYIQACNLIFLSSIGCTDPANICPGSNVIAYTLVITSGGNIVGSDVSDFLSRSIWY
jgi:hypothetical protein